MNVREKRDYLENVASQDLAKILGSIESMASLRVGSIDFHNARDDAKSLILRLRNYRYNFYELDADTAKIIHDFIVNYGASSNGGNDIITFSKIRKDLDLRLDRKEWGKWKKS